MSEQAVFDCNVYFQALIGPKGPAGVCLEAVRRCKLTLFSAQFVIDELEDVCLRPKIARKFRITETKLRAYLSFVHQVALLIDPVPQVFQYPRDPKDAPYLDLAIATEAKLLVSRDKDLLALNDPAQPEYETLRQGVKSSTRSHAELPGGDSQLRGAEMVAGW